MSDPLVAYEQLKQKVDGFYRRVVERYPEAIRCRRGCDDCCQRDLELFPFEVEQLIVGAHRLTPDAFARVRARAERATRDPEAPCAFLEEGACLVYEHRSVLCRTHGLALLVPGSGSVSICPHNFLGLSRIDGPFVLDLGPVNQILATVHHLLIPALGNRADRVSVAATLVERLRGPA